MEAYLAILFLPISLIMLRYPLAARCSKSEAPKPFHDELRIVEIKQLISSRSTTMPVVYPHTFFDTLVTQPAPRPRIRNHNHKLP